MTILMDNTTEEMQLRCFLVSVSHSQASQTYILTKKIKFLCNLEAEIWTFLNSLVSDGGHFEYCSIKKHAQHAKVVSS